MQLGKELKTAGLLFLLDIFVIVQDLHSWISEVEAEYDGSSNFSSGLKDYPVFLEETFPDQDEGSREGQEKHQQYGQNGSGLGLSEP